jgi:hypothetical protein
MLLYPMPMSGRSLHLVLLRSLDAYSSKTSQSVRSSAASSRVRRESPTGVSEKTFQRNPTTKDSSSKLRIISNTLGQWIGDLPAMLRK